MSNEIIEFLQPMENLEEIDMCLALLFSEKVMKKTIFDLNEEIKAKTVDTNTIYPGGESFSRSNLAYTEIIKCLPADRLVLFKKSLNVFRDARNRNDTAIVLKLLKKYFKKHCDFLDKSYLMSGFVDLAKILNTASKSSDSIIVFGVLPLCLAYFCVLKNYKILANSRSFAHFKKVQGELTLQFLYNITNYSENVLHEHKAQLKPLFDVLGISDNKSYTVNKILDAITLKEFKSNSKSGLGELEKLYSSIELEKSGIVSRYIGVAEGNMKLFHIFSHEMIGEKTVSKNELAKIVMSFIFAQKFNNLADEEFGQYFINTLYSFVLAREYNLLKDSYVSLLNEDMLELKSNFEKKIQKKNTENYNLSLEIKGIKESFSKEKEYLVSEIERLKKVIRNEEAEKVEFEELKTEVVNLRNFVFDTSLEKVDRSENDIVRGGEAFESYINNHKVVFIGCREGLVSKLKDRYGSRVIIVNSDNVTSDFSFLKNVDKVLISTTMSHALYFKAIKYIKKYNVEYMYIKDTTNVETFVQEMINKNMLNI